MESGIESVSVKEEIYVHNCLFAPNMETLAYFAGELKLQRHKYERTLMLSFSLIKVMKSGIESPSIIKK